MLSRSYETVKIILIVRNAGSKLRTMKHTLKRKLQFELHFRKHDFTFVTFVKICDMN